MRNDLLKLFVTLAALNGLILAGCVQFFYVALSGDQSVWPFFLWVTVCLVTLQDRRIAISWITDHMDDLGLGILVEDLVGVMFGVE